jgi:hypothetical protein
MRIKLLFITLIAFLWTSCGEKEVEPEKKKVPTVGIKKVNENIGEEVVEDKVQNTNPLSEYVSDEVYKKGIEKFYNSENSMFIEDSEQFKGSFESLETHIKSSFQITMLATQNGKTSAVLYYVTTQGIKRTIVTDEKVLEIGEHHYYIKIFKDRAEIKQGKKGRAVPLYLRKR